MGPLRLLRDARNRKRSSALEYLNSEALAIDPRQIAAASDSNRYLLQVDPEVWGSGWPDHYQWQDDWLPALAAAAPLQIWAPLLLEPALVALPLPAGVRWRWLLIEPPVNADLKAGGDLPAAAAPGRCDPSGQAEGG